MAKNTEQSIGDDLHIGSDDAEGPVEVRRLPDGRSVLLPRAPGAARLGGDGLEVLADVQQLVRELEKLRGQLDELVAEARQYGVPWSLIGFSVGIGTEGARKRWAG